MQTAPKLERFVGFSSGQFFVLSLNSDALCIKNGKQFCPGLLSLGRRSKSCLLTFLDLYLYIRGQRVTCHAFI